MATRRTLRALLLCGALAGVGVGCVDAKEEDAVGGLALVGPANGQTAVGPTQTAGATGSSVAAKPSKSSPAVANGASVAPSVSAAAGSGAPALPGPAPQMQAADAAETNATDRYQAVGSNPFVMTEHDPFSTFGADVDTASYEVFRRDIGNHMLPQPAGVRLEEYVNYFKYDYPAPESDAPVPFAIALAAAPNILDAPTTILRVGVQASKPEEFVKKPTTGLSGLRPGYVTGSGTRRSLPAGRAVVAAPSCARPATGLRSRRAPGTDREPCEVGQTVGVDRC